MAFDVTTICQLALLLLWTCITTGYQRSHHPIFKTVLSSKLIIESLVVSASVVFAPGLLEVMQLSVPPTIAYFKTLPTKAKKGWAVYLLVLEKPGCRPRIYIGSGTHAQQGYSRRLGHYDSYTQLPVYVALSLKEGYTIVHKGILCWCPMPAPADVPKVRVLFVGLETVWTFALWGIKCTTEWGYGLSHICPWDRSLLEYDGTCSHNPMSELPASDCDLTAEELDAIEKERAEKQVEYMREWHKAQKEKDPEAYRLKSNAAARAFTAKNPLSRKMAQERTRAKSVAEKRHYCTVCDFPFNTSADLARHLQTKKHADKVARQDKKATGHYCAVCKEKFSRKSGLTRHLTKPRHAARAARLEQEVS